MKRSLGFWQVVGFGFTSAAGTLLHFLFEWSNGNIVIALFSAVNESIWEHMKLLFVPLMLFSLLEYRLLGKQYPQFWPVKLLGTVIGLGVIPVLYYTYTGIFGRSVDLINITIFYVAAAVAFRVEYVMFRQNVNWKRYQIPSIGALLLLVGFFVFATFSPPRLPLFQDPVMGLYGYFNG